MSREPALRNPYVMLAWLAFLWAVGNTVYVYLVLGGARTFRVETAAYILAAVLFPLIIWRPPGASIRDDAVLTDSDSGWLMLFALGLWLLTLGPFVALPLLGDDYVFLARYRRLPDLLWFPQFFRPMFGLVFLVLTRAGGGSPVPFHLAGFSLHAASAWFVYVLTRRLFGRTDRAALCSTIVLLNPLQMEAVLWPSGLQDLLWTFFVLAALVVYTGTQLLSPLRLFLTLLLIACAVLAKETAVASVLLVPATDWAFFRMKRGRLVPFAYPAVVLLIISYLLVRSRFMSLEGEYFVTPGRYFIQKFIATPYKFFVQPWNPTAVHVPAVVLCSAAVSAFTVLFVGIVRGTGPMALAGPAVILISTLPVFSYFFVREDLLSARYIYFAAIGWGLLVTQLVTTVLPHRRSFAAAFAALVVVMFVSLQVNVRPWRIAGQIADDVKTSLKQGRSPARDVFEWQAEYGTGFEVKEGVPIVYRGVNVFINGYPELCAMISARQKPGTP